MTGHGSPGAGGAGDGRAAGAAAPAAHRSGPARGAAIGLVFVGGAAGVAVRESLSQVVPTVDGVPVVISVVNVLGAFVLGYLYERLARRSPGPERTARLKLLVGTGFCGGLTTYSSLATDTAVLLDRGRVDLGLAYALGTVLVGALATLAGIAFGGRAGPAVADSAPPPTGDSTTPGGPGSAGTGRTA